MIKLSQKAWNNVIIISMLVLIILFNSSANFLNGGADTPSSPTLLPNGALISTMQFSDYKIERVGQGWRALGVSSDEGALIALTQAWQNAKIDHNASDLNISQATASEVVYIWLVSQKEPLKFELFQLGKHTLVLSNQRLLQLSDTEFSSLFLSGAKDA